jgi:mono/diheme cytochrome c family protein
MILLRVLLIPSVIVALTVARLMADDVQPTNGTATTAAVYVPDMTHAGGPLPDGVLVWNGLLLSTNVSADEDNAHLLIAFTNISSDKLAILNIQPGCHCTTAQLPPMPWLISKGASGEIPVTIDLNIAGHEGTLFKSVKISTDKGSRDVLLKVIIEPVKTVTMTDEERALGMAAAKVDRQAIFKGDCATCHVKPGQGKYNEELYKAVCGVCHEAEHRATMVPDLHAIKTPTNEDFWRTWIMHGKPGSLMPAFSSAEGGPLNDVQIASLTAYLNAAFPSKVPPPPQ